MSSATTVSLPVIAADDSQPGGQRQLQAIAVNLYCTAARSSYSAAPRRNTVGPDDGQLLVAKAVEAANGLWETER